MLDRSASARWSGVLAALLLMAISGCKSTDAAAPDAAPDAHISPQPDGMSQVADGPLDAPGDPMPDVTRMDVPCGPMVIPHICVRAGLGDPCNMPITGFPDCVNGRWTCEPGSTFGVEGCPPPDARPPSD
jgi:hypothetical protein